MAGPNEGGIMQPKQVYISIVDLGENELKQDVRVALARHSRIYKMLRKEWSTSRH